MKNRFKGKFELIKKHLINKENLLFLLIVFIFIIFHKPIEIFLSKFFVKNIFTHVESSLINDIIFLLIFFYSFTSFIKRIGRYTPSFAILKLLIIISFIYGFYRYEKDTYNFTSFLLIPNLKYADILFFITFFKAALIIKINRGPKQKLVNSFFDDEPIGLNGPDILGYSTYANLLSSQISNSHFQRAFAIGINGKWGLGKTSFLDLLKRKLSGTSYIEINFNPWNSSSPKAIIQDFFETVQDSLRPYHSSLSRLLILYSNRLLAINENNVTKAIQSTVSAITGYDSLKSLFDDINNALKKINKKIIIYIDDLDRLDKEEVVEVIRLIRNNANFYNTVFIVAYDRNYVVHALKSHNSYNEEQFLEKIFQIEITLPYFNRDILRRKLAEKLKEKLPKDHHKLFDDEIIGTSIVVPIYLNDWMESMRDVNRLANAIVLNYSMLIGEVDFNNFLRLELLRIKFPSVYELLFKQTDDFLEIKRYMNKPHEYKLKFLDGNSEIILQKYIYENLDELSVPENAIKKIMDLLNGIFTEDDFSFHSRSNLSVVFPSKFHRYFEYCLSLGALSEIKFSKARTLKQVQFNRKITKWVNNKLEIELKNKFVELRAFDDRSDFEKIIRGIFHLATQTSHFTESYVGYDAKNLCDKLNNYENILVNKYYDYERGLEDLKSFIIEIFEEAKSPFSFEADFIRFATYEYPDLLPLSHNELESIALKYFRRYCLETSKLDWDIWRLFHDCKVIKREELGGGTIRKQEIVSEEAKEIMKNFILKKDFDGFLKSIIQVQPFNNKNFCVNPLVLEIFNSWENFEAILVSQNEDDWVYLNEFKMFFSTFAETQYSQFVYFNFVSFPIRINK